MESMLPQRRTVIKGDQPTIATKDDKGKDKTIKTSSEAILLGGTVHESTSWKAHIETGTEAFLPKIRRKLGMLKHISKGMSIKGKLLLANGYIISQIIYLIPLWGGICPKYSKKIQVVMNNTARWITGMGNRTSSMKLMIKCNWMNLQELSSLHSLTTLWKILRLNKPRTLKIKFEIDEHDVISTSKPRLKCTKENFRHRTTGLWNSLPSEIRGILQFKRFKVSVMKWILGKRNPTLN